MHGTRQFFNVGSGLLQEIAFLYVMMILNNDKQACHATQSTEKKCSKNDASAKIVNVQQKWGEHV